MAEIEKEKLDKECLENFIVNNHDLENLEDEISGFNIFEAIGMQSQEIRHSATLAFLMEPKKSHGLGQYFLKKFLKNVVRDSTTDISPIDLDSADFSDAEVRREWRNIDILIICRSAKIVIAIENKIWAAESEKQLSDYHATVTKEGDWVKIEENKETFKNLFIFLTVDGNDPREEKDHENWISYSHGELVKLLQRSLDANSKNLGPDQDVLIRHYIELMRRWILEDSNVAELAQKIYKNHKQAIDLIVEHRPDTVAEVAEQLKQLVKEKKNELELVYSTKTYIRFICNSWTFAKNWSSPLKNFSKLGLCFEFENRSNRLRLVLLVFNLENTEHKSDLKYGISKKLNYTLKGSGDFPRVWVFKELSLKETDHLDQAAVQKKINDWWEIFVDEKLDNICKMVDATLDELKARPSSEDKLITTDS